jgi:hypothetical protein
MLQRVVRFSNGLASFIAPRCQFRKGRRPWSLRILAPLRSATPDSPFQN